MYAKPTAGQSGGTLCDSVRSDDACTFCSERCCRAGAAQHTKPNHPGAITNEPKPRERRRPTHRCGHTPDTHKTTECRCTPFRPRSRPRCSDHTVSFRVGPSVSILPRRSKQRLQPTATSHGANAESCENPEGYLHSKIALAVTHALPACERWRVDEL